MMQLELVTADEIRREDERRAMREKIARRLAAPIKGCGRIEIQPQFDLGQTGQQDLFEPIMEVREA